MSKEKENCQQPAQAELAESRSKVIVRTSVIGIAANILLAGFKAAIGLISNSIAVVLDAVNNLSDALSSVITIIGTKLAGRPADKKHPMGHGRIEYLSAMIIAAIVLYAGITSLIESIKKIIDPETADYSTVSLIIIGVAILTKIFLGRYVKKTGERVNSGSLIASGSDAMFDAILSASVLASAIIFLTTGISLEAYVGVVISGFIIKAGIEMMMDTLGDILGRRPSQELSRKIKDIINSESEVRGAYDLFLNDYGPNRFYGSVHIELRDTMTVEEVDILTRRIEERIFVETGVIMTGVGVYSYNTQDTEAAHVRNQIVQQVMSHDWALQLHGFHLDSEKKIIRFDVVMSFDIERKEGLEIITREVTEMFPQYSFMIVPDVDISDI
ncbi:MAG: cation transporter [Lachnospiraceae bacterium]|nr:cation transporter [Lachnospiraceae bacterium]